MRISLILPGCGACDTLKVEHPHRTPDFSSQVDSQSSHKVGDNCPGIKLGPTQNVPMGPWYGILPRIFMYPICPQGTSTALDLAGALPRNLVPLMQSLLLL